MDLWGDVRVILWGTDAVFSGTIGVLGASMLDSLDIN